MPPALRSLALLWCAALCLVLEVADAQTVTASATACVAAGSAPCPALSFGVALEGFKVERSTVGLDLGPDRLALSLMAAETFGPLGNVVFEASGELREGPFARARVAARGVIASVAARLALTADGADAERFDPLAVAGEGPLLGGPRVGLELGGTFRLDRQVVLDVAPALHLAPGGTALTGGATLRLLRALGENELQVRLGGALLPGAGGEHVAAGAALVLPRGRAPDWRFGISLGYGDDGFRPGGTVEIAEALGGGARAALTGSWEPYRRDVRPLRAAVALELPLSGATAEVEIAGGALHPTAPDALRARLSLRWPFAR